MHCSYQRAAKMLSSDMTLPTDDRRLAWECARDDAHLAFRVWCEAPLGTKRDAYTAYRAAADREDVAICALMTA
jgi:predicted kinase